MNLRKAPAIMAQPSQPAPPELASMAEGPQLAAERRASACQLVVSTEPPFRILAASTSFLEVTGYAEEDVVYQTPSLFEGESTCAATAARGRRASPPPCAARKYRSPA